MTVAIVDSSEQASLRLGSLISGLRCIQNVIQVIDRGQIYQVLNKIKPGVIIYDLNGVESIALLEKLRSAFPDTRIIALASFRKEQYSKKCREIGINLCLDKVKEFNRIPGIITAINSQIKKCI